MENGWKAVVIAIAIALLIAGVFMFFAAQQVEAQSQRALAESQMHQRMMEQEAYKQELRRQGGGQQGTHRDR